MTQARVHAMLLGLRRLGSALLAVGAMAWLAPVDAQTIGVNAGVAPTATVLPNGKIVVPVIIDLTNASATNIASLATGISWNAGLLTFDSLRVAPAVGWSFTPNIASAGSGTVSFTASNATALPATATLANIFFTATGVNGGTRVTLTPTAAANALATSILPLIQPRMLDLCVALSGLWGDVTSNDVVDIIDAQQIARASVELSVLDSNAVARRGDVNADGVVNIIDAQQIARFSVGLSTFSTRPNTSAFVPPVITSATLAPGTTQTLAIGGTVQLVATALDGASADISGCSSFTWASSNGAVATVNASGFVTGVGGGSATITATSSTNPGVAASVGITVTTPPTIHVVISHAGRPARQYIAQVSGGAIADPQGQGFTISSASMNSGTMDMLMPGGGTYTVRIVAIDAASPGPLPSVIAGGQFSVVVPANATVSQPITLTAPTYTMTTLPVTVPTNTTIPVAWTIIDPAGLIDGPGGHGLFCGAVVYNMTTLPVDIFGGANSTACVGSNPLPGTMGYSNSTTPVPGQPSPGVLRLQVLGVNYVRTGSGSASDIQIFYVSPSVLRGEAPLSITIQTPITAVTVTPASPSIPVGVTQQLVATATDASSTVITGNPVSWSSGTPSVAKVSASGVVTGLANGTSVITASVTGVLGTTTVTVSGGIVVGSISVAALPALSGNSTTTAIATVRDPSNVVIPGAAVIWSSSNPMVARVAEDGTVQALGTGTTNIIATIGAVQDQTTLTVNSVAPQFNITLVPRTSMSAGATAAFASAQARWMTIIRSHDPDVSNVDASQCLSQASGTTVLPNVNGVVIYATIEAIDGVGGILGQAGPCLTRIGSGHAIVGTMRFDEADIANMESNGTLNAVILHEMAHVLGFGTNWSGLLANPATFDTDPQGDPTFIGVNAQWAMQFLGTGYGGALVPVENCCQGGTRNAHWRESVLQRELMTGFVSSSGVNPLSPLTAAQFIDLGYVVDVSQADQSQPWFLRAGVQAPGSLIQLREGILPPPIVLDQRGRVVGTGGTGALRAPIRPPPKRPPGH